MVILLKCILQSFAQESEASRSILLEEAPLLHKKNKFNECCSPFFEAARSQKYMPMNIYIYIYIFIYWFIMEHYGTL